ncbi:hypothetical protein DFH28DRAFT_1200026 [Melampsora americana]|nr:hypothetical protein DFH28DRAFT_1200026 [Melampsora americana]
MAIEDEATFKEFMNLAQSVPGQTVMGFKIFHKNPKLTANANCNVEIQRKMNAPKELTLESDHHPESEGLAGVSTVSVTDFKAGKNIGRLVNPKDPSLVMILNTARIQTWANDWADEVPGVDEVDPPTKCPEFRWFPVADYEKEKNLLLGLSGATQPKASSGTVIHHNYYGQQLPGFPPPQPHHPLPQPATPNVLTPPGGPTDCSRWSPPPEIPPFKDFLIFAGITPNRKKTCAILADEGIDDFGRLLDRKTYSFENLQSMGIPFAWADDLYKAVPKFNHHLKSL